MKTTTQLNEMLQTGRNLSRPLLMTTIVLAGWTGLTAANAQAAPIVIEDTYIGGTATHSSYVGKDVIGDANLFDVSRMEVSVLPGNTLRVDVFSRYFDNIGIYETQLGDLFLSTVGYRGEGESWEYVLKLDNHLPDTTSGTVALYEVQATGIVMSSAPAGYIYRAGQEAQYDPAGQSSLATGSWSLHNVGGLTDTDDFLRFTLAYDFGPVSSYGLHWTMTCGNDVIEGAAPVPEPSAILLFGVGMMGLGGVLRRKFDGQDEIRIK